MIDPWKIEGESDGQYIMGEFNGADVYVQVEVNVGKPIPPTLDAHMAMEAAPLHLIAAAPAMLDALEYIQLMLRMAGDCTPALGAAQEAARAALAAARGDSPSPTPNN